MVGFSLTAVIIDLVGQQKIIPLKKAIFRGVKHWGGGVILKLTAVKENPTIDHFIL